MIPGTSLQILIKPLKQNTKIVVGATAVPHAEILKSQNLFWRKKTLIWKLRYYRLCTVKPFLKDGQIDANFFQHIPYLEDYNKNNDADLAWTLKVHNEPMGIYSNKYESLEELPMVRW